MGYVIIFIGKMVSSNQNVISNQDDLFASMSLSSTTDVDAVGSLKTPKKAGDAKKKTYGAAKKRRATAAVDSDDDDSSEDASESEADEEHDQAISEDDGNDDEVKGGEGESSNNSLSSSSTTSNQNKEQLIRLRDSLLAIIIERTHDKSPYTRSNVLKVWSLLLEDGAIPVRKVAAVADVGFDRLIDKTASVRKNAVCLMTSLLENNPFGCSLDINEYMRAKAQIEVALLARFKELQLKLCPHMQLPKERLEGLPTIAEDESMADADVDADADEQDGEAALLRKVTADVELEEFMKCEEVVEDAELKALKVSLEFNSLVVQFLVTVGKSMSLIESLLSSKTNGDVVESLKFFTRAVNFGVQGSAKSLRK